MSASAKPETAEIPTIARRRRQRHYITATVEVDISDIDTEDLIDELESRGVMTLNNTPENPWVRAYEALRYKSDPLPEIKQLVMDATGRLL